MKEIPLTQGYVTKVSDEDYEDLSKYNWCVKRAGNSLYAFRAHCYMHRRVVFLRDGKVGPMINHKDFDTLNNQRENLESVTQTINNQKRKKRTDSTHKYRGISKAGITWQARFQKGDLRFYKGGFKTSEEAAKAYDEFVRTHLGSDFPTNFAV